MIVQFKVTLETGFSGATHADIRELDVPDEATQEEIDEMLREDTREWALERIEYWHEIISPKLPL